MPRPSDSESDPREPTEQDPSTDDATLQGDTGATIVQPEATGDPTELLSEVADTQVQASDALAREAPRGQTQVFAGRFEVLDELGEGGMGKVYRVRDRQIEGREVALKVLHERYSKDPRFRELFFQEIHAAQSFVSENVVQVRDTGQMDDGKLFLTMDMVAGQSLTSLLSRENSLSVRHALEVARQILLGLQSGHEHGFVHRDVKPSNVMLADRVPKTDDNPFGVHVKLLDFGLAGVAANMTEGAVSGTPRYMSPEQAQGHRLDARSDLFAVGIVLYEMLTGKRPFGGKTLKEITTSVIETSLAPLIDQMDHVPGPVIKILKRALRKDRDNRFQSAAEFIKTIEGSKAYRMPTGVPGWLSAAIVLLLGAVAAGGWYGNELRKDLAAEKANLVTARSKHNKALTSQLEEFSSQLEAQRQKFEATIQEKEDLITGLNTKLTDETGKASAETGKLAAETVATQSLDRTVGLLKDEVKDLKEKVNVLTQAKNEADSKKEALEQVNADLQQRIRTAEIEARPDAKKANGFDEILSRIQGGLGRQAWSTLQSLVKQGFLDKGNSDGGEFVENIATAAERLYTYRELRDADGRADVQVLQQARDRALKARELEPTLAQLSRSWNGYKLWETDPDPDRIGQAQTVLEGLIIAIDTEFEALAGGHDAATRALLSGLETQRPVAAIQHQDTYACNHVEDVLARFAQYLQANLESEGRLDEAALLSEEVIDEWGTYLTGGGGAPLDSDAAETVRMFWYARLWYGSGRSVQDVTGAPLAVTSVAATEPSADWRALLTLQQAIAAGDGVFVGLSGSELFYRQNDIVTSSFRWQVDTIEPSGAADQNLVIKRKTFFDDPRKVIPPVSIELRREGDVFFFTGGNLNLRSLAGDQTVAWTAPKDVDFPDRFWRPTASDHEAFIAEVEKLPAPCLVAVQGDFVRWISPVYGLVREERKGFFERELVHGRAARR